MNVVDRWRERLGRVDPQRWLLGGVSVAAAALASLAAGSSGGGHSLEMSVIIVALAVVAAVQPTTHTALPVVLLVTWQWLATTDDELSAWSVVVAATLVAFHALIALLAAAPPAASIDRATLRRWSRRTAIVATTALLMWGAVALDGPAQRVRQHGVDVARLPRSHGPDRRDALASPTRSYSAGLTIRTGTPSPDEQSASCAGFRHTSSTDR